MRRALPLLAGLSLAFAPLPFHDPERSAAKELKKLQGAWKVIERVVGYGEREVRTLGVHTAVFTGDRLRFSHNGTMLTEYRVTLGPGKTAKTWDCFGRSGGEVKASGPLKGIYRLEGDTLVVRFHGSKPLQERPKDFESTSRDFLDLVFTRVKP